MDDHGRRVTIVTGASGGIGAAIAARLLRDDHLVLGADVDWPDDTEPEGGGLWRRRCDVTDRRAVAELFVSCTETLGPPTVVVNAAGVSGRWRFADLTDQEFASVIEVNLIGTYYCMKEAVDVMLPQGSGTVVNIASFRGIDGSPYGAPYAASKAAVIALTKSVAAELSESGLAFFAVLPGATDTKMWVASRSQEICDRARRSGAVNPPERVADVVAALIQPASAALTGAIVGVRHKAIEGVGGLVAAPAAPADHRSPGGAE